ncbi:MAG: radical SAM protein [Candidatus Lernaella stagnicola]|nr:radical SAM protein [Candidatus Lernaella stagnicola]
MANILLANLYKAQRNYQIAPPLGLLYLAAVLRNAGHEVRVLDLRARQEALALHLEEITAFAPDVVGLSAVILEAAVLRETVTLLKSHVPMARIVVGGPYAHSSMLDVLRVPGVDAVVRGEGELVLPPLVAAWESDVEHLELPGVGYPGGSAGQHPEPVTDLDALPWPAWDLAPMELYHEQPRHGYLYKHKRYYSVSSSRGCPFKCAFCQNVLGRKYRVRQAEAVVEEITRLYEKYMVREIHFIDDCFNLDLDRAKRICELLIARNMDLAITFPVGLRADRMDRELIDLLARAGCFKIPYGIETASPRLQRALNKNVNFAKLEMVIDYTVQKGMMAQGFFILGLPDETEEEARQTVDYALKSKLTFITFNLLNVLPGTPLWETAAQRGLVQDFHPEEVDYDNPPIHMATASRATLKKMMRRVHLRFYLHPFRLWRIWRRLPHKKHFFGFLGLFWGKLTWLRGDH